MVATNVSFAALQIVLLALFILTYSVHFAILSFLSLSLWWAINWFASELKEADNKEKQADRLRELRKAREEDAALVDSDGSETEGEGEDRVARSDRERKKEREDEKGLGRSKEVDGSSGFLSPGSSQEQAGDGGSGGLRKRMSVGEVSSGDLSTDSEWDKVEEAGEMSSQ